MKKPIIIIIAAIFLILISFSPAYAKGNLTVKKDAEKCLNSSMLIMEQVNGAGFNITRINDTLSKAETLFDAQDILLKTGKGYDFSIILSYCNDIEGIKESAYSVKDEYFSLINFYNETYKGANMSEADKLIEKIQQEINDERYEKAQELIPDARKRISEIQAEATALNLFYGATSTGLKKFLKKHWIFLSSLAILAVLFYFVYRKRISKWLINRKIRHLEIEKSVLKSLIQKNQYSYFHKGEVSEGTFHIRIDKFSELIRDIDRQIPLLREELAKISMKHEKKP